MKQKLKYSIILTIFILSFLSSIVLSFVPIEQACGGINNGCYQVQTSNYESTLGIKNSTIGLIAFAAISLITIIYLKKPKKHEKLLRKVIFLGVVASFIYAIYFIYLQIFVIKALCKYCMVIDAGALINFVLILWREK